MKHNGLSQWLQSICGYKPSRTFGWLWRANTDDDNEEFDCPTTARPRLVEAWLALAQQSQDDPEQQLRYYEGVLKLEPEHPEARQHARELRARLSPLNQMESNDVTECATS